jgi:hypothetical protein
MPPDDARSARTPTDNLLPVVPAIAGGRRTLAMTDGKTMSQAEQ